MRPRVHASSLALAAALTLLGPAPPATGSVDTSDTRLIADPAVHGNQVAFEYAGDLWIADASSDAPARRLTSHPGDEVSPVFSPDGEWIAFSGSYDGNFDVYVVPAAGGEPRRLTWHPGPDVIWGFTPDSSAVLFGSARDVSNRGTFHLFRVDVAPGGGFPERLAVPTAFSVAMSPDGRRVAYNPLPPAFQQWKNYRGGRTSRIWIQNLDDDSVLEVPQPAGRCNDIEAMWLSEGGSDTLLFLSDRNGEFNLFSFDVATQEVTQLTEHDDFPILRAATDGTRVVYEQAGYLHRFDTVSGTFTRLVIGVAADLAETRPRWESGDEYLQNADVSPSGARAVLEFRGEIVTVPADKGDVRNLTLSPGSNERSPAWSPDGMQIAYLSDASGEYRLVVAPQDGRGEPKSYPLGGEKGGAGFYDTLRWSPDGKKISYLDNSWSLFVLNLESGDVDKVHSERVYGPVRTLHHAWSPDSRWLAYTRVTETYFQVVSLYSLDDKTSRTLTDGLADVGEPVFDSGGKVLYFYASTDSGPIRQWFAQSNNDRGFERELYLAVLPSGEVSPLAKESDEEVKAEARDGDDEAEKGDSGETRVDIDFDGLDQRIQALPVGSGVIWNLQTSDGKLYYLHTDQAGGPFGVPAGELMRFSLAERKAESMGDGVRDYRVAAGGKKLLAQTGGGLLLADAGGKIDPSKGQLAVGSVQVKVDPRREWQQIFHEAWRINRDYFYDPNMHGADWDAMHTKYAAFLPHLAQREDLNRVLQWMSSELAVGHHRVGGGDESIWDLDEIGGGLLGADFEIDGDRYRFARVFGGLNWNDDLRAPLTEAGVEVKAGEYLLAVDGRPLTATENVYARFENTAGKIVELEVGPSADGTGSRTVQVVPVDSETSLRNRAWVEDNMRRVHEATDGRVAYVYVPNTTVQGHTYFKRYFFPQARKDAIIVDERFNGGGQVADYYIDMLRRPRLAYWTTRYGETIPTPIAGIHGPKVMLINEVAGSGGDLLPWMFRQTELGPLIGRRTWGGLVGILGFPALMDGGRITAPNLAFWTPEEGYGIENVGVPPDIEVEQWPAEVNAGRDPQLERAIEVVLELLERNPPPEIPEPPPFPIRVRR